MNEEEVESGEEWVSPSFPTGAHVVNIQRGDKGFGVVMVEEKVQVYIDTHDTVRQASIIIHSC